MTRKKVDPADKKKHLDFVYLSDEEYSSLCGILGPDGAADWIEELNIYLGKSEKNRNKYDSHYWAIRGWARRAGKTTAATIAGNAMLAAKAAEVVIEALKDPRYKTMPEFTPQAHRAAYTVLAGMRCSWPELKRRVGEDPRELVEFKTQFLKAY